MNPRATMGDVAARAGVSRATVSLALRDHPRIPPATRARVAEAANALGYQRHPLLSALMATRRKPGRAGDVTVLAYVSTRAREDALKGFSTYRRMRSGAGSRAEELGYVVEDFSTRVEGMNPKRLARVLHHRGIRGLLVAPLPGHESKFDFPLEGFAAIGLGLSVKDPAIPRVASDHFLGAWRAVHACHALGYRRFGLIVQKQASERLEGRWVGGFLLACEELGIPQADRVPPFLPPLAKLDGSDVRAWCRRARPDVVLLGSYMDEFPLDALPEGVGVASLGVDSPNSHWSGIWGREDFVGKVAVDLLVDAMNSNRSGPVEEVVVQTITPTWVAGTTAPGRPC